MRYVIVIMIIAVFIIWDGFENDGHYLEQGVRMLRHAFQAIGL